MKNLSALTALALCACVPFDVPPDASGVFPCTEDDDCPGSYSCVARSCRTEEAPSLEILSPEDQFALPAGDGGQMVLEVRIGGKNMTLVEPGSTSDAVFGEGQVVVFVDGAQAATLTSGNLENQVSADVFVVASPGAHQISAFAQMSNGARYDNAEAIASSLLWIDDGQPHVGIKRPQSGAVYPLEATEIEVEVATLNFNIVKANPNQEVEGGGHVHLHYNDSFPACVDTPPCDNGFISIMAPVDNSIVSSITVTARLPASPAGDATLTATLREATHFAFFNDAGDSVFTDIRIRREASSQ